MYNPCIIKAQLLEKNSMNYKSTAPGKTHGNAGTTQPKSYLHLKRPENDKESLSKYSHFPAVRERRDNQRIDNTLHLYSKL
jgi:hypothetical protein